MVRIDVRRARGELLVQKEQVLKVVVRVLSVGNSWGECSPLETQTKMASFEGMRFQNRWLLGLSELTKMAMLPFHVRS